MSLRPRRSLARALVLASFALAPLATSAPSQADDLPYVECPWAPYHEAWACSLPATFEQGRFNAPPDFRHDEASTQARQRTWVAAKEEAGARSHGRVGVFVPSTGGAWLFVPGSSWSPGDPVFLPPPKTAGR
jgi:hypothetical protein